MGAVSLGFGPGGKRIRRKVSGKTKTEVIEALQAPDAGLDRCVHFAGVHGAGVVEDWLEGGLRSARL